VFFGGLVYDDQGTYPVGCECGSPIRFAFPQSGWTGQQHSGLSDLEFDPIFILDIGFWGPAGDVGSPIRRVIDRSAVCLNPFRLPGL